MEKIHLFFIPYGYSGAGTYTDLLVSSLRKRPDLVVHEVWLDAESVEEFTIEDWSSESGSGEGYRFLFPVISAPLRVGHPDKIPELSLLKKWVKKGTSVFHFNSERQYDLAERVREMFGAKTVCTVHYLPFYYTWNKLAGKNGYDPETIYPSGKRLTELCDRTICVTRFARECLTGYYHLSDKRVKLVYNGCPAERSGLSRKEIRSRLGISSGEFVILFVGRINRNKGIYPLLKAFDRLAEETRNVRLIFAGGGDFSEIFAAIDRYHARITFLGKVDKNRLNELYRAADTGVLPSIMEQCSYVALEMMQAGLPIIASDIPGLNELIIDKETGLLVSAGADPEKDEKEPVRIDIVGLTESLHYLKENKSIRKKYALQSRKRWHAFFQTEKMVRATIEIYKEIMQE